MTEADVRVTKKGQVTIPRDICVRAGLRPGMEVEVTLDHGKVVLKPMLRSTTPGMREILRAKGTANHPDFAGWRTDRIMRFLRGSG